jgi:hypothetical protein
MRYRRRNIDTSLSLCAQTIFDPAIALGLDGVLATLAELNTVRLAVVDHEITHERAWEVARVILDRGQAYSAMMDRRALHLLRLTK